MQEIVSICLGISLSAACGFRVFVPMLVVSGLGLSEKIPLNEDVAWIATGPAFLCFLAATIAEIAAYYIPWVDNALDSLAWPASIVAGTLMTAAMMGDLPPEIKWSLAFIAGGGSAGVVKSTAVGVRGASSLTTGGLGNFVVATGELVLAVFTTICAFLFPVLVAVILFFIAVWVFRSFLFRKRATVT
jgi:Domain of unknown function (DUF4126)